MKNAWRSQAAGAALIMVLTMVTYLPALHCGFIWDDDDYVTKNSSLQSLDGLKTTWLNPRANPQYYPLVFTSFWAEYHFWGLKPFGYHLVNVLLHALNAVLLWRVLRRLDVSGAWLAAAIFAIHPVMVESVAWITERKNVLSCLFYLLAALAFLRFRPLTDAKPERAWDWRFYPMLLLAFLCALLSKTVTCTLPAALLLVVWWKTGRVEKRDALAMAPLFVLGTALGLVTLQMEKQHVGAVGADWTLSFVQRCLLAGRALWFYAGKLFWPRHLTFVYPRWEIDAGVWWQYVYPLAALAMLMSLWRLRQRMGRGPLVAVLCFAGTLVPALGFFDVFPFRYSFVADHFQYLACIGLITLAAGAGAAIYQRAGPQGRDLGKTTAAIVLVMLGVSTWNQARTYRDQGTLWRDTLAKNPTAWIAHNNLGALLAQAGMVPEAMKHWEQALQIKPDYAEAHYNLGNSLLQAGRLEDAIAHYEQALRLNPGHLETYNNLASALSRSGKATEAIGYWERALQIKPDYAKAHHNLAGALMRLGRVREAIDHWNQALRTKPDYAEAHYGLGNALAGQGRSAEALEHYQKALDSARSQGNTGFAAVVQTRLKFYEPNPSHRE